MIVFLPNFELNLIISGLKYDKRINRFSY